MDLQPGSSLGQYVIEDRIGKGGMATVYRVRHQVLGSVHALKLLTTPQRSVRERLLQEGRVQATLRHPNVVGVTDVVTVDGAPGLVMEHVGGPTLAELLSETRLGPGQAVELMRGIVAGVAAAHRMGVIHRDLKPANVLVELIDGRVVPRVADFGLVKALDGGAGATRTGATMGTPAYMAPEQIRDASRADVRSDLFSLGAILYEMATGERAFPGDGVVEIYRSITSEGWQDPAELAPGLPAPLLTAIRTALRADPKARLATCGELGALLDEVAVTAEDDVRGGRVPLARSMEQAVRRREASRGPMSVLEGARPSAVSATLTTDGARSPRSVETTGGASSTLAVDPGPPPTVPPTARGLGTGMLGFVYGLGLVAAGALAVLVVLRPWEQEPPLPAAVVVDGAEQVTLVSPDGAFPPGSIPAGRYTIRAAFDGQTVDAGEIELAAGEAVHLTCDAASRTCARAGR